MPVSVAAGLARGCVSTLLPSRVGKLDHEMKTETRKQEKKRVEILRFYVFIARLPSQYIKVQQFY